MGGNWEGIWQEAIYLLLFRIDLGRGSGKGKRLLNPEKEQGRQFLHAGEMGLWVQGSPKLKNKVRCQVKN